MSGYVLISQQNSDMLIVNVKLVIVCVTAEAWQNCDMLQKTLAAAFALKHKIGIFNESFLKLVSNIPRDNKLVLVEVRAWYDKTLSMARFAVAYMCNLLCVNYHL